jgi:protein-tyrosine phosphatase
MIRVLFVCLGNICRSPLAEGIFKKLVGEAGLEQFIETDSAGTSGWHIDEPPDTRSIQIAGRNHITLDHLGKQILRRDLDQYDYILAMDRENLGNILKLEVPGHEYRARVMLMREFDEEHSGTDIPDPYYGGEKGFQDVYDLLEESLRNFLDFLIRGHQLKS